MVNNSTNINKTNNHLSSQIIEHKIKTTECNVDIPGPGLGHNTDVGIKMINVKTSYIILHMLKWEEEFEDTKGVIRIHNSVKNRQHNGKKKMYKSTKGQIMIYKTYT